MAQEEFRATGSDVKNTERQLELEVRRQYFAVVLAKKQLSLAKEILKQFDDVTRGIEPWFVLSGHTLMVGDMGRTELASSAEEGARALFRSAGKLKELPDYVEVLPGAFSGSVCGRSLSGKPVSTIGFERKFNVAFRIANEDTFVHQMLQSIPTPPPEAAKIRAINSGVEQTST